jgi:hypothetical protein
MRTEEQLRQHLELTRQELARTQARLAGGVHTFAEYRVLIDDKRWQHARIRFLEWVLEEER